MREHGGIIVVESYQTARSACAVGHASVNMIKPQTAFDKQYRHGVWKYQFLKQPRISPSKSQQRGVAVSDAAADKSGHRLLCVRRVAKYAVMPRLSKTVIGDCITAVRELPRRVYRRTWVEIEMTECTN